MTAAPSQEPSTPANETNPANPATPVNPPTPTNAATRADVILVHGLWMPRVVMALLAARLRAQGFRTHLHGYSGRCRTLEHNAERLRRFVRKVAGKAPVHMVAHSLGGLVVLAALGGTQAPQVASVVLLGTPARGCLSGRRQAGSAFGRWMLGKSRLLWNEDRVSRWDGRAPLGVVAGSGRSLGLGRLLGRLPGVNDGVVRFEETTVDGMTERIVLPVGHSAMVLSSSVARQTTLFLSEGRFSAA